MKAWPLVLLGEVITHRKEFIQIDDSLKYKRCRVQLHAQGIVLRDEIPGIEIKTKAQQVCRKGEFLVAEIDAKVGGFGIVPPSLEGAIVSGHYFLFSVDASVLDVRFLGYYIKTAAFRDQVLAQGSTNYAAIRPSHVLAYTMPLPPIEEQRRIVERIAQVSYRITGLEHLAAESDKLAHSLMPSFATATFGTKHWPMLSVEEFVGQANLSNGLSLKSDGLASDIRCLRLSAMRKGNIDCSDSKPVALGTDKARQYLVHSGDVFIVRGNGSKELVGKAGVAKECPSGTIFPDLFIRVPLDVERMIPAFFVAWWNSPTMRQRIEAAAKTTSGIWKINQGHIASFPVPVPPVSEQIEALQEIEKHSSRADGLYRLREASRLEMTAVLPSLLNQAFSGRF
jgi:type I restriction enzyme S subunit